MKPTLSRKIFLLISFVSLIFLLIYKSPISKHILPSQTHTHTLDDSLINKKEPTRKPSQADEPTIDEQIAKTAKIIVQGPKRSYNGSGFFISNSLLITNYHVIKDALGNRTLTIQTSSGNDSGSIFITDPENDLAIIETDKNTYDYFPLGNSTDIQIDDQILVIGSPEGNYGTVSRGKVTHEIGGESLAMTAFSTHGSSGSPVISKNKVVGIVFAIGSFWNEEERDLWQEAINQEARIQTVDPHTTYDDLFPPLNGSSSKIVVESTTRAISVDKLRNVIEKHPILELHLRHSGVNIGRRTLDKEYDFYQDIKTVQDMFHMAVVIEFTKEALSPSPPLIGRFRGPGIKDRGRQSSFHWLKKAAEEGYAPAQFEMGLRYYYRNRLIVTHLLNLRTPNIRKSFSWFSEAANSGHAEATYFVGKMYGTGQAGTKDLERSFYWVQQAAEVGVTPAKILLAIMYQFGKGVTQDSERALQLYEQVAEERRYTHMGSVLDYIFRNLNADEIKIVEDHFRKYLYIDISKIKIRL